MTRLLAALVAVIGVLALAGGASAAKPVPVNSFTDFTVAATPPNPAGTFCPGSPLCYNGAAEPAIGVTPNGRFYASSENGLGGGTLAWSSADNGLHYASTPSPNDVSTGSGSVGEESGLEPQKPAVEDVESFAHLGAEAFRERDDAFRDEGDLRGEAFGHHANVSARFGRRSVDPGAESRFRRRDRLGQLAANAVV